MTQYTDTITQSITSTDTMAPLFGYKPVQTETTTITDIRAVGIAVPLSASTTVSETFTILIKPGAIINEVIQSQETLSPNVSYKLTQTDQTTLTAALLRAYPQVITESITASELAKVTRGMLVLEGLNLLDTTTPKLKYYQAFIEALKISDSFRNFVGGNLSDAFVASDTLLPKYYINRQLADQVNVSSVLSNKLMLRLTLEDDVDITDTEILKMVFKPVISDRINLSAAYVSPDGNIVTWAINTRTGAVTEYDNFSFNSFAQVGHKYIGANSSGLYELNGDTDDGDDIIAKIKSGYMQFGGAHFSSFKAAYLGVRGNTGDEYIFRLVTADGKTYDYQVQAHDMRTTKIHLGKGLRARYFAFELESTGPDFDLESVEFIPLVAQRRV